MGTLALSAIALAWLGDGFLALGLAGLVYFGRAWSERNRWLAAALACEGANNLWVGLAYTAETIPFAWATKQVWIVFTLASPPFFLLFVSTFETPLVRHLRTRAARAGLLAWALVVPWTPLLWPGAFSAGFGSAWYAAVFVIPGPGVRLAYLLVAVAGLAGLAAAASAYRRAPPGSAGRAQMLMVLAVFAVRDAFVAVTLPLHQWLRFSADWLYVGVGIGVMMLFHAGLGYAILRHQMLDVRIRAPRLARRAAEAERLALYRAALEGLAEGDDPVEAERLLAPLRATLRVSEAQHRAMREAVARQLVLHRVERRGRFRVVRELGRGGQGRVLLARDLDLQREVVLKQPLFGGDRASRARLLQEARAVARIRHPNIVAVLSVLADDDPPFLVLEHVPGGSAQDLLDRHGPLPAARAARILADVLRGLERLHAEGLVHCDLKPANVLLDADGTAKVGDFGAATRALHASAQLTPGFASPEALRGEAVDARSDVFAAGALLRALLEGATAPGTVDYASRSDGLRPPGAGKARPRPLPPGLAEVVARATAPAPGDRYPGAAEMRRALERALPPGAEPAGQVFAAKDPWAARGGARGAPV